ncbi:MAG: HAD family hydrolase [Candidatus Thorarchaeota archaeon]|nr:MAG: phosphoserine phosphatase [Candidatus Thorarchaeota archaeon]RLI53249.1 MAG: phosphoserine phosphatase [Candidatus Thorarchaeota archaeon]
MTVRLVVFDADGTLTQHSSIWWRLHEVFGTTREGKLYYDRFFAGEITYDEWADLDAALWKGRPLSIVEQVVRETELVPGAKETVSELHNAGIRTAILSGGLDILANDISRRLGIDYVLTNRLIHRDGVLTGEVESLVGWGDKHRAVRTIAKHFGVSLRDTAFVGDGRNDVSAMAVVGLAIAFMPETEEVARAADVVVRENDLRAILPHVISEGPR